MNFNDVRDLERYAIALWFDTIYIKQDLGIDIRVKNFYIFARYHKL